MNSTSFISATLASSPPPMDWSTWNFQPRGVRILEPAKRSKVQMLTQERSSRRCGQFQRIPIGVHAVALFKNFVSHRPAEMCTPDSPFYLAVNQKGVEYSLWSVVAGTSITRRKTNHSARKTMVETLCRSNITDSTVMQLSKHKSVQSLNHYKKPLLDQQRSISHLLSSHSDSEPSPVSLPTSNAALSGVGSSSHASTSCSPLPGPFSNASFSHCSFVLNFGGPSQQLSSHSSFSSSLPSQARPPRKRPMVIYDSSDED